MVPYGSPQPLPPPLHPSSEKQSMQNERNIIDWQKFIVEENMLTIGKINAMKQDVEEEWGLNKTINEEAPAADESEDEAIALNDERRQTKEEQMVPMNERNYKCLTY